MGAKPARRRYLKQNFNFVCLCKACTRPPGEEVLERTSDSQSQPTKGQGLASLLSRWMQDERDEPENDAADNEGEPPVETGTKAVSVVRECKKELTDEERVLRVVDRCKNEGFEVSISDAQTALEAESGHVGKTMIRLRKERKN